MRIALYCKCGAYALGAAQPSQTAKLVEKAWRELHAGEGHGPATADEARKVRRRRERNAQR